MMQGLATWAAQRIRSAVPAARASFATREAVGTAKPVNAMHAGDPVSLPPLPTQSNACGTPSAKHWNESWSKEDQMKSFEENVTFTWGAGNTYKQNPLFTHGKGIYLYDVDGKEYIDWTSQAVCSNLGHTVPDNIQNGVNKQMQELAMMYSGLGLIEIRARLSSLFAEICPGDINGFLFPSGGNEANEAAIRIARRFTGKRKILCRHRSYHGGSSNTISMTGDFRRRFVDDSEAPGFVRMFDPNPWFFDWADDEEMVVQRCLAAMNDQILAEGPHTIAAVFIETIPGSGGVLIPPKGYIEGVRALCDEHGILMIADEVMLGFGRSGTMFGFQNFENVVPDIVTFAKGISGAFLPLSGVGMRQEIKEFFDVNPLGWGATYNAHPVAMACGYETMKYMLDNDVVGHAKRLEPVMVEEMQAIVDKHACIKQARAVGLFGCFDLIDPATGKFIQQLHDKPSDKTMAFKAKLKELGVFCLFRPPLIHTAPPLIITKEQLRDGFARIDKALEAYA